MDATASRSESSAWVRALCHETIRVHGATCCVLHIAASLTRRLTLTPVDEHLPCYVPELPTLLYLIAHRVAASHCRIALLQLTSLQATIETLVCLTVLMVA